MEYLDKAWEWVEGQFEDGPSKPSKPGEALSVRPEVRELYSALATDEHEDVGTIYWIPKNQAGRDELKAKAKALEHNRKHPQNLMDVPEISAANGRWANYYEKEASVCERQIEVIAEEQKMIARKVRQYEKGILDIDFELKKKETSNDIESGNKADLQFRIRDLLDKQKRYDKGSTRWMYYQDQIDELSDKLAKADLHTGPYHKARKWPVIKHTAPDAPIEAPVEQDDVNLERLRVQYVKLKGVLDDKQEKLQDEVDLTQEYIEYYKEMDKYIRTPKEED